MSAADLESSALEAYHAAANGAQELIRHNVWDEGIEKWKRALDDVAPYITSEQLDLFKRHFDNFFQLRRDENAPSDDTGSDSSESQYGIEDCNNKDGNDSADAYSSAIIEGYQAEHMKLAKRHTMRPPINRRRILSRSSTISMPGRRSTSRFPRRNSGTNNSRPHTSRGDTESDTELLEKITTKEPTISNQFRAVSKLTTSPVAEKSSFSGSPECEDQATRSSTQSCPSTAPGKLMGSKENDDWFSNLQKTTHNFVYGENREFWPAQPVRVAILDSGFALTGEAHKAMKPYWSRIKDKRTFTDEFPLPQTPLEKQKALDDPVGHGTTVAYQLMKTCPSAHVYIAKVTVAESDHKQAVPDKAAISRAIRYAAAPIAEGGWGVDVINMSFGWSESELPGTMEAAEGVSGAIELAEKKGVLLFAAASNYGLSQPNDVLYPARDSRIIPVDAEDGLGNPAPFALHSQRGSGGVRYCAPGLSVDSPVSAVQMCGSSFACPVAAGVAALVLEFARHQDVSLSKSESVKRALSSAKGMLKVFGPMSQQAVNHPGFNMLYPWFFLGNTQREEVALNIIRQLEIEFGKGNVGHEVVWTTTWQAVQNYSK